MAATKKKTSKGQTNIKADSDIAANNPLLYIENKTGLTIETSNLLEDPSSLIYNDFENFDLKAESDHFDLSRLNDNTTIIVILRYYEYICKATFTFDYIYPMLQSGLTARDIFDMTKHALRNKLLLNAPSFDVIFEPEIQYTGKVRY